MSLLTVVIPITPALADESLRLNPSKGEIGQKIQVIGHNYDPGDAVYIYFSGEEADEGDDIDDLDAYEEVRRTVAGIAGAADEGDVNSSFIVPEELTDGDDEEDVESGIYFVYTTYTKEGEILAVAEFAVTGVTEIKPAKGTVGTKVEIKGVGFDENADIAVFYGGSELEIASGDETDEKGDFELTVIIPKSAAGDHSITIKIVGNEDEIDFTVEPEMSISATSGMVGDKVRVTGTGFGSNTDVTVTFSGDEVATGETDKDGNFSIIFEVPNVGAGTYKVEAQDEKGNSGEASFTMATNINISPVTSQTSPGYVGMPITINGTGFKPNTTITITYTSTPTVFTTTSKSDGSFSYTFEIPASSPGEHTITATDGTNSLEVDFFMESEAPAIPQPIVPLTIQETKPERPITFEWQNVSDPSGVTYILQVAKDKDFTSMVLLKEGLTESSYTMTQAEDEALESTKEDAPYWWRVRAEDGASNMSNWSSPQSFYVGFTFEMPNWAIYLLIGLGVLLLLFIGFLLLRRSRRA
jgi:hypothetical protein